MYHPSRHLSPKAHAFVGAVLLVVMGSALGGAFGSVFGIDGLKAGFSAVVVYRLMDGLANEVIEAFIYAYKDDRHE